MTSLTSSLPIFSNLSRNVSNLTINEEVKVDFTAILPNETILAIFSYLNSEALNRCLFLNKKCYFLVQSPFLWKKLYSKSIFDKNKWRKYFEVVVNEPDFPFQVYRIFEKSCPFTKNKKIKDTHTLYLIPKAVSQVFLTISTLADLVENPKTGNPSRYRFWQTYLIEKYGEQLINDSYWLLVANEITAYTESTQLENQLFLNQINQKTKISYRFPTLLEASISIFTRYIQRKEPLPSEEIGLYTRCQETAMHSSVAVVGGLTNEGLVISDYRSYQIGIKPVATVLDKKMPLTSG